MVTEVKPSSSERHFLKALGPGLLLAAVAVGVSHLVQSTRAGAVYGFAMLIFIVGAIVTKYPTYRFAPQYTQATGVSMVEGFRRQGRWALALFALVFPIPALVAVAAVTIVTAGVAKATFFLGASPGNIAVAILAITAVLLITGRYHWLDLLMKPLMLVLTLTTVAAALLVLPHVDWSLSGDLWPDTFDMRTILFTAALIGWMPAPLESAVIHTLWLRAKVQDTAYRPSARESSLDFHIGYVATLLLAVCFLVLGTGVMHGKGIAFEESAGGFAAQVMALYTETLGDWSRPLIAAAALAVMYSTVIAAIDGFSRITASTILCFRGPEGPSPYPLPGGEGIEEERHDQISSPYPLPKGEGTRARGVNAWNILYVVSIVAFCAGAVTILMFFLRSFKTLIDIATTLSFLTTPVLAFLIHRSIMSADVPAEARPGRAFWGFSVFCIGVLTTFAVGYLLLLVVR